jgi:hypothetical protein
MRGIYLLQGGADTGLVARGMSLRHLRPARFRRRRAAETVEELTLRISALVAERQELRDRGASEASIERNRVQLARAQWELGHALIDVHLLEPAKQPAA